MSQTRAPQHLRPTSYATAPDGSFLQNPTPSLRSGSCCRRWPSRCLRPRTLSSPLRFTHLSAVACHTFVSTTSLTPMLTFFVICTVHSTEATLKLVVGFFSYLHILCKNLDVVRLLSACLDIVPLEVTLKIVGRGARSRTPLGFIHVPSHLDHRPKDRYSARFVVVRFLPLSTTSP